MLKIKVVRGTKLRNVQRLLPQDPYVVIYFEDQKTKIAKSPACIHGGVNPTWRTPRVLTLNQTPLARRTTKTYNTVIVEAWDYEFMRQGRLIGRGKIDLTEYEEDGAEEIPLDVDLVYDEKKAGSVSVLLSFEPSQEETAEEIAQAKRRKKYARTLAIWNYGKDLLTPEQLKWAIGGMGAFLLLLIASSSFRGLIWFMLGLCYWLIASIVWYMFVPVCVITCIPRLLGWGLTKVVFYLAHGYPITFGTISIVPYATDFQKLRFRLTVKDFFMGNPTHGGFTPRFLSLDSLDLEAACTFAHLWNCLQLRLESSPLKKIPDYERLITFEVSRLEFQGVTLDFQVSPKTNRLNINEMTKEFAIGEVHASLRKKGIDLNKFHFPNCLEVQVLRARNLKAMDANGLSDPFYAIKVRKEKRKSETVVKTLNPVFSERKIEQFAVSDPSTVLCVQIWDEDIGKKSDFIGQWIITTKWLLMDPKHCRYTEWEKLPAKDEEQGWVGLWAPLLDQNFRGEGTRGEVHLRIRWRYDPSLTVQSPEGCELPVQFPPITRSPKKPLDQISENRVETRQRIGDLNGVMDMLNRIPVLFKFTGPVIVRDSRISIKELLFGRKSTSETSQSKERRRLKVKAAPSSPLTTKPVSSPPVSPQLPERKASSAGDAPLEEDKCEQVILTGNVPAPNSSVASPSDPRRRSLSNFFRIRGSRTSGDEDQEEVPTSPNKQTQKSLQEEAPHSNASGFSFVSGFSPMEAINKGMTGMGLNPFSPANAPPRGEIVLSRSMDDLDALASAPPSSIDEIGRAHV